MSDSEVEEFHEYFDQLEEVIPKDMGSVWAIILVDSGSTHDFIDAKQMHRLSLLVLQQDQLKATVANGSCLFTRGLCNGVR
ncbi:hypothetical protein Goarm_022260 [Gossypium armourianum]|uniref:Uncharacterized protein n=1 Tax=Gossypium armourianum TaxID=34283 RepID=A0A7J9KFM5_9ROSI|nr:hypothetical protein [Gossypium armourianum]